MVREGSPLVKLRNSAYEKEQVTSQDAVQSLRPGRLPPIGNSNNRSSAKGAVGFKDVFDPPSKNLRPLAVVRANV
jgi:hypothetical protein